MPHGAFIPSKMRIAAAAGQFARARKDICLHTQSVRWTAVLDAEPRAGEITDGHVLLADRTPAGVFAPWDRLDLAEARELYPLYRAWDDTNPPVGPIACRIACSRRPDSVTIEPGGGPAPLKWSDGTLEVTLPRLEIHACLAIRPWERPGT